MKDLLIKPDAFRKKFDLPINLVYGKLGSIVAKFPWKNIYTQPIVITIEDVYVLAVPNVEEKEFDPLKQALEDLATKRAELLKLDEERIRELKKSMPPEAKTFTEKMLAKTINNVQLHFKNIHIRYEDSFTSPVQFAAGLTLGDLSIYSTDSDWGQEFRTVVNNRMFKLTKLDGLAAYMNCDSGKLFQHQSQKIFEKLFLESIARLDKQPLNYSYGNV